MSDKTETNTTPERKVGPTEILAYLKDAGWTFEQLVTGLGNGCVTVPDHCRADADDGGAK